MGDGQVINEDRQSLAPILPESTVQAASGEKQGIVPRSVDTYDQHGHICKHLQT